MSRDNVRRVFCLALLALAVVGARAESLDELCTVFAEDMETGAIGWTSAVREARAVGDPPGPSTWHLGTTTCRGDALGGTWYVSNGNDGVTCTPDSARDFSQLLSPPIVLPADATLQLDFDALSFDEAGPCLADARFDKHDVGVTVDGGATYTLLNDCTALADGTGAVRHHRFDVTAFAGQTIQLIWVYDTVDSDAGHTFAVDNVLVRVSDCATAVCGDGSVDLGEECDDGNVDAGDGCAADCTLEPFCGDGNLDEGEECDDDNDIDGDGCSGDCTLEPFCGDGNLDAGEECDDGNNVNGDGCAANCTIGYFCGDGGLDDGEECDDGNVLDGDGCSSDCTIEPFCGDGNLDEGEECDDGNVLDGDGCSAICSFEGVCGDGILDSGEECDDGNNVGGDGCSAACTIEGVCGDGDLDVGEECDDGNVDAGDGCSSTCTIEPFCGDGNLDAGEECDDGNGVGGDGCSAVCAIEEACFEGTDVPTFTAPGELYTDTLSITAPGDEEWYAITVDTGDPFSGTTLRLETISDTPDDPREDDTRLWLYTDCDEATGDGVNLIEFDDDSGQGFMSLIDTQCLPNDKYYLRVSGWEDVSLADNITLEIEATSNCETVVTDPFETDDDRSRANEIAPGESQFKSISPAGDEDWNWFDLGEPRLTRITTIGADIDTAMGLFYASPNVPIAGLCNNTGDPDTPAGTITTVITNGCNVDTDCPDNVNPIPGLPDCLAWDLFDTLALDPVDNVLAADASGGASELTLCLPATVRPSRSESVNADPADPFHWFVAVGGGGSDVNFNYEVLFEDLGPCDYESLDNDDPASADALPADGSISGIFDYSAFTPARDNDFYSFDVPYSFLPSQSNVFEIAVASENPSADAFIELFLGPDQNGDFFLVAADDDGGPGLLPRFEIGLQPASIAADNDTASYYANVTAAFVTPNYPYELSVTELDNVFGEIDDFGDCDGYFFEGASPGMAGAGSRFLASIYSPDGTCDYDGFAIRLETDRDLTIVTNTDGDTTIQLVDCTTEEILACDDDTNTACTSGFCSQIDGCLPGGRYYCVRVRPFSTGSQFDYEIDIRDNGDCVAQDPPVVTSDLANVCGDPSGAAFNDGFGCSTDYVYVQCLETPLLVTMVSLSATQTTNGVEISWTTAAEVDTIGFRVLREDLGSREKYLEPVLISPLIRAAGSPVNGASYSFVDAERRGVKSVHYYVDDVDGFGRSTRHGPILFVPNTTRHARR